MYVFEGTGHKYIWLATDNYQEYNTILDQQLIQLSTP